MCPKLPSICLFFALLFVMPSGADAETGAPGSGARDRPNIIVIMADDLGWSDLHFQGNETLDTPHLDRLALQSVRFTDAYAAAPVCTPTRAAMMTGQSPARLRITNHAPGNPDHRSNEGLRGADWTTYLDLGHTTIAEHLRSAGYSNGFVGKWHLSHRVGKDEQGPFEPRLRPQHQGYDLNIGGCRFGGPPSYFEPYRIPNISPRKTGEYLPDRLADECIEFVRDHQDKPFFLTWWNYAVHYPIEAPEDLIAKYRARAGVENPAYAAMIEAMDRSIGKLLDELDTLKLAENTFLLFTSDNGSLFGNKPLRANKGYLYEGGIRVPMLVRWKGNHPGKRISKTPTLTTDVFPTLMEVAGIPLPSDVPCDGESLMPLLTEAKGKLSRDAIHFHYPNYAFHKGNRLGSVIRSGDHKLIKYYDGGVSELFDLSQDIAEQVDLATKMPERASDLERQLDEWLAETGANMPVDDSLAMYEVTAPPAGLNLPAFYEKHVSARGYPVVGSAKAKDEALREAAYLINCMLARRPDIRKALISAKSRMVVMAHNEFTSDVPEHSHLKPHDYWDARARGLGGEKDDPVCSCGEENLLCFKGDPYHAENILIHEFAHNIHLLGLARVDKTFDDRLRKTYDHAMAAGLWKGKYASVDHKEYFAEGVQSWFNNNRPPDHDHNHVDTRAELKEYDPGLARMCQEVFRNTEFEYTRPTTRLSGHLAGYDPEEAPEFVWPEHLQAAKRKIREEVKKRTGE